MSLGHRWLDKEREDHRYQAKRKEEILRGLLCAVGHLLELDHRDKADQAMLLAGLDIREIKKGGGK